MIDIVASCTVSLTSDTKLAALLTATVNKIWDKIWLRCPVSKKKKKNLYAFDKLVNILENEDGRPEVNKMDNLVYFARAHSNL